MLPQQGAGRLAHQRGSAGIQSDDLEILQGTIDITHGDQREDPLGSRVIDLFDEAGSALGFADMDERDGKAPVRFQGQHQDLMYFDDAVLDAAGRLLRGPAGLQGPVHDLAQDPCAVAALPRGLTIGRPMQPNCDVWCDAHDGEFIAIETHDGGAIGEPSERAKGNVLVARQRHTRLSSSRPTLA